jgi:hypothetical protein
MGICALCSKERLPWKLGFLYLEVTFVIVSFTVKIDICISEVRILFVDGTFYIVHQRRQTKQCAHFSKFSFRVCLRYETEMNVWYG